MYGDGSLPDVDIEMSDQFTGRFDVAPKTGGTYIGIWKVMWASVVARLYKTPQDICIIPS